MTEEYRQLKERISQLSTFMGSDFFNTLPEEERHDIKEQVGAMDHYATVLERRLKRKKLI